MLGQNFLSLLLLYSLQSNFHAIFAQDAFEAGSSSDSAAKLASAILSASAASEASSMPSSMVSPLASMTPASMAASGPSTFTMESRMSLPMPSTAGSSMAMPTAGQPIAESALAFASAISAASLSNEASATAPASTMMESMKSAMPSTKVDGGNNSASNPENTGTRKCNGFSDYCDRKYSDMAFIGTHNAPFVGSLPQHNQKLTVEEQMQNGIRYLQGQVHLSSDGKTLLLCHTTCSLENAGPVEDYVRKVVRFLDNNPDEVITLLFVNGDFAPVEFWGETLKRADANRLAYEPPAVPLPLDEWPTMGNLIQMNKRLLVFLDFEADQSKVPFVIDEFSQVFETPFGVTDKTFPGCAFDRPAFEDLELWEGIDSDRKVSENNGAASSATLPIPAPASANITRRNVKGGQTYFPLRLTRQRSKSVAVDPNARVRATTSLTRLQQSDAACSRMFVMNHFLDRQYEVLGQTVSVPDRKDIAEVNMAKGTSGILTEADTCHEQWSRYPNVVLINFFTNDGDQEIMKIQRELNMLRAADKNATMATC